MTCTPAITPPPLPTRITRRLPVLLLAALLNACGGGGGGNSTPTPPPPPPPPPPPAFAVASMVPADAASGVARDAAVTATFNATLDAASVSTSTVVLLGPNDISIPLALKVTGGTTLEVRPTAGALPADTPYRLRLFPTIKDSTGRELGATGGDRSFRTAGANWSATAGNVATVRTFDSDTKPSAYSDATGRTTLAWVAQDDSLAYKLNVARLDPASGNWGTPAVVATETGNNRIFIQQVLPGPGSDVFVLFRRFVFLVADKAQLVRYSAATGTWGAPVDVVQAPAGVVPTGVAAAVGDASGNLTVLSGNVSSLFATRLDVGTNTWSTPVAIHQPDPTGAIYLARVVADANGNLMAAWFQSDADGRAVYAANYLVATGQWGATRRVSSTRLSGSENLDLGVSRIGAVTLAWTRSAGVAGGDTVWYSQAPILQNVWQDAARVSPADDAAPDARLTALVVDSGGVATALWNQGSARVARLFPGATGWSASGQTVFMPGGVTMAAGGPMLVDTAGNIVLLGVQPNQTIMATRFLNATSQWQAPVTVSTLASGSSVFSGVPVAAMDGAGNVAALWFAQNRLPAGDQVSLSFNRFR